MPTISEELLNAVGALEKPWGVIAFPTDTVYGLGCKVDHPEAIARIYQLKGRDETKPLILLGADAESLEAFVSVVPHAARELMTAHWPGGLTLVLPKNETVPDAVTRGGTTVGIRVPDCDLLRELLALVPGKVLATTSANRSGYPPCLGGDSIRLHFGPSLDYILEDDQALKQHIASTVAAVEQDGTVKVLRMGAVELTSL